MSQKLRMFLIPLLVLAWMSPFLSAQEEHDHAVPETLGSVSFPISCKPSVQKNFNRGVALLHSFAYTDAEKAFSGVAVEDSHCAMAHWGIAMTRFHQLWEPPISAASIPLAQAEIKSAQQIGTNSERERNFIDALALIFQNADTVPYRTRTQNYAQAMKALAADNKNDVESQVFYALALLANSSPSDKTHTNQKQAIDLLEPLYLAHPQHPGIPHYIIHSCDNAELAPRGLQAARDYSKIASSTSHALHMPSHIFTRLGLWDDSIASNSAARDLAREHGDTGEELHAMDYLVYAYLQGGRDAEAAQVIHQLTEMTNLNASDFKIGYAATVMPIRYVVERRKWADAAAIVPPATAPPQVVALAVWARGQGLARSQPPAENRDAEIQKQIDKLRQIEEQLHTAGNDYWAIQAEILTHEVMAWSAQADNKEDEAVSLMQKAADEEDGIEKLPVTPGPIVPAREQLGDLLLAQGHPDLASREFKVALANAPGRRGSLEGAARAAKDAGPTQSSR